MKKSSSTTGTRQPGSILLIESDQSGRDEMNLAGNPFALLQPDSRKNGQTHIKYEWDRRLPSGKIVQASWEVNGHGELGLPGPSDELLYLVLLELTREKADEGAIWPQIVPFSRYEVMDRLGWSKNAREYRLLRDCFARLQAVSIQADNAFYDARTKAPLKFVAFNLLDDAQIADEPRGRKGKNDPTLPLSYFKWSDRMHASFTAGNVRALALNFVVSLEHPTARRLFRMLELFRNAVKPARREFTMGVLKLRDRMGMVNLRYASKVKERLAPAHKELIARGFLAGVHYSKSRDGNDLVHYFFAEPEPLTGGLAGGLSGDSMASHLTPGGLASGGVAVFSGQEILADQILLDLGADAGEEETSEVRIEAARCHAVFIALPEAARQALRSAARENVAAIFWDRLENPESPISLTLWELVAKNHPELLQRAG